MSERRENDHYVTPEWAVRRFLEGYQVPARDAPAPRPLRILDPCAARGELLLQARKFYPDALLGAGEINPLFEDDLIKVTQGAVVMGDFLQAYPIFKPCQFDLVLTNPPYALAEQFIRAALEVAPTVAMLLRINFLASQRRRNWLAEQRPGVFVLPNRPSFTGEGGDMTEYAWFTFGDPATAGQIDFLDLTPSEVIREANRRGREIHGTVAGAPS